MYFTCYDNLHFTKLKTGGCALLRLLKGGIFLDLMSMAFKFGQNVGHTLCFTIILFCKHGVIIV